MVRFSFVPGEPRRYVAIDRMMPTNSSRQITHQDSWADVESRFQNWIDEGHDPQPILPVINHFRQVTSPCLVWPSTSMFSLGLSAFRTYSDAATAPMVYVGNITEPKTYLISFFESRSEKSRTIEMTAALDLAVTLEILNWLTRTSAE